MMGVETSTEAGKAPAKERIGVCLSGGGFRAALYGLGALRYMAEASQMPRVDVICGVSGGSIAATALAAGYKHAGSRTMDRALYDQHVLEPFVASLADHNLRNKALGKWLRQRWKPWGQDRGDILGEVLCTELFPALRRLEDLPGRPQLVITTTELRSGHAFRTSREFLDGWPYGYAQPSPSSSVGHAVAASAAVPIVFPPFRMQTAGLKFSHQAPERLTLVDGGVYDNIGLEWIQGWDPARRPPQAIESDFDVVINASGPLRPAQRLWGPQAWNRTRQVQYAQTQATRVRWLIGDFLAGRRRGVYLGITADPRSFKLPNGQSIAPKLYCGALPSVLVPLLADIRTDLNRFRSTEAHLLAYHGYWSAHARFKSLHPAMAVTGQPAWNEFAEMSETQAAELVKQLSRPRHRFGLGSKLR